MVHGQGCLALRKCAGANVLVRHAAFLQLAE